MEKIKAVYTGDFQVECVHGENGAKLITYAPKEVGGNGKGFSPTDLLITALGSCMLTLLGMTAQKLGVEVKGSTVEMEKEMTSIPTRRLGKAVLRIRCPHSFSQQIREKLEKAVIECPVHRSLHPEIKIEIDFIWGM